MDRTKWIKIILAVVLSAIPLFVPFESMGVALNPIEKRMISIFIMAALLWILEPVPIWSTSVFVMVLMLFTVSSKAPLPMQSDGHGQVFENLINYKAIMATFAEPTIMLFLGGFFLAAASTKYNLDLNIARVLLKPFGHQPKFVLLGLMMVTALFSMFMSNTATTAMMLAILTPVLALFNVHDKGRIAFALSIPIGANVGGMGTPIGTPPNAIAMKALGEMPGLAPISFGKWMLFGVPYMLLMVLFAWFLLLKLFPSDQKHIALKLGDGFDKSPRAIIVYVTFGVTVLLWMFGDFLSLNSNVVAMIPMAVFALTKVITVKDVQSMGWDVIWLFAGGFALGLGLKDTGLAADLLDAIPFASWSPVLFLVGAALIGIFMSTFMSNTATAGLLIPIIAALGVSMGPSLGLIGGVYGVVIGVALSCSLAMSLPISTPPNALAYSTGFIKGRDMAKTGLAIGLVGIGLLFAMMLLLGGLGVFSSLGG